MLPSLNALPSYLAALVFGYLLGSIPFGIIVTRLAGTEDIRAIGSGNIGSDLMFKLLREPGHMELAMLSGIDPKSEGLERARALGIGTTHEGIQPILDDPEIKIVFDATSAYAHVRHAKALREAGRQAIAE